ncbi:hypothetical protein ID866_10409 [Astraeus odoratus]|nr:hypothetical protein ID866_10409 [Astraeus odoratus]
MTLDMLSTDFLAFQQDSWNLGMSILRVMGKGKGKERFGW